MLPGYSCGRGPVQSGYISFFSPLSRVEHCCACYRTNRHTYGERLSLSRLTSSGEAAEPEDSSMRLLYGAASMLLLGDDVGVGCCYSGGGEG